MGEDMTEITKLLKGKTAQEFDALMYGVGSSDYDLYQITSPGLTFNDTAIECICCLLILQQCCDLSDMSKNRCYSLYCTLLGYIGEERPDIKLCDSVFTRPYFAKFINTYPQILQKAFE